MNSPVETWQVNKEEVTDDLDAVLVVDTVAREKQDHQSPSGFRDLPTVCQGYLRVSEDLLDVMQMTTGKLPYVFALTQQDITPYGNGIFHLNSILQPHDSDKAPVVAWRSRRDDCCRMQQEPCIWKIWMTRPAL